MALPLRAAVPRDPDGTSESALDERYLAHGLNVLCRAHATDPFYAGHVGGAFVSAYYLGREGDLEAGSAENPPRTATPARIAALRRTIRALEPRRTGARDVEVPESPAAYSEFVLQEFLGSTEGGPGQGFAGHLLTYGRAILDLRLLGHERFAQKSLHAFTLAVKTARPRSPPRDYREERKSVEFVRPDRCEYWKRRAAAGTLELGHLFKYPYGFFGLRRHSKNPVLNQACLDHGYRLFRS